jgi:Zn finger protein HypA/HybF involved in hydrogenase expression
MSDLVVRIRDNEEKKIWDITEDDCVYKCPNCGKEKKVIGSGISCPTCKCGEKMEFRWWTDRDDIEFETIE